MILPGDVVDGVGGVEEPVPPVAAVYHNKLLPVAVSIPAADPSQYLTGLITAGAASAALTVTVIGVLGLSQEPSD